MGLTLTTPPTQPALSLADAKLHLRVTHDKEDARIDSLIAAATAKVALDLGEQQIVTATHTLNCDRFMSIMEIPKPPLQSVTSVKYIDTDGTQQTLSSSVYQVITDEPVGYLKQAYGQSWPSTRWDPGAPIVEIIFVSGYGDPDDVPTEIVEAIKMVLADLYDTGNATSTMPMEVNPAYWGLIGPHRLVEYT